MLRIQILKPAGEEKRLLSTIFGLPVLSDKTIDAYSEDDGEEYPASSGKKLEKALDFTR
jgi:hypothetical protein